MRKPAAQKTVGNALPHPYALTRAARTALTTIEERALWLACWTIHNANHLRDSRDGLKVGGHQASTASMTTILTALFFKVLRAQDRISIKPHASPAFHALQHMFGRQSIDQLQRFRGFGGAQSYPSRTKDQTGVDFSTGSVGLGVAITAFSSLVQDYLAGKGLLAPEAQGRMIATLGDAELDEGNVYECLIEGAKHDLRNCWWIVDYNRQSLDAVSADRMFSRFGDMFAACGWDVKTLKFGTEQQKAFAQPGGAAIQAWIEAAPNDVFAALSYEGGAAFRAALQQDLASDRAAQKWLSKLDDAALGALMTQLGGHCLDTLLAAFAEAATHDRPTLFIAYTIKGYRLPFQGHKDNHAGLMNPSQIAALRAQLGVPEGEEWDAFAGLTKAEEKSARAAIAAAPWADPAAAVRDRVAAPVSLPPTPIGAGEGTQSTQAAFGKILNELARQGGPLADRLVTMSPDVTVSTNLGGFVNRRGLFRRSGRPDLFKTRKIASPQVWASDPTGQHVELGIAENNLFLSLAAFGLAAPHFGARLIPIGTLYDPFIARGLDALNYACYQDARFILVATPSGLTLGPEGGAHQSINPPLIGMGQPGLTAYEPAFAEDLAEILHWAFGHVQAPDGGSVYLRLSTRPMTPPARLSPDWRAGAIEGGYWLRPPREGAALAIIAMGAILPEAMAAVEALIEDVPEAGLLVVTSPGRLQKDWRKAQGAGSGGPSPIERLLAPLAADARLVTVLDGSPAALSWIGGVRGMRVASLGVEKFGQTGDLPDLYRAYGLDADAILDAAASLF